MVTLKREVHTVSFPILKQVGTPFSFRLVRLPTVVESRLVAPENVHTQRIIGRVMALGKQQSRNSQEAGSKQKA